MSFTREFPSKSRPDVTYTATLTKRGLVSCVGSDGGGCPGHTRYLSTRGGTAECWHIRELREEIKRQLAAGEAARARRLVHCARCRQDAPWPFESGPTAGQSVCGECADDLRAEQAAAVAGDYPVPARPGFSRFVRGDWR